MLVWLFVFSSWSVGPETLQQSCGLLVHWGHRIHPVSIHRVFTGSFGTCDMLSHHIFSCLFCSKKVRLWQLWARITWTLDMSQLCKGWISVEAVGNEWEPFKKAKIPTPAWITCYTIVWASSGCDVNEAVPSPARVSFDQNQVWPCPQGTAPCPWMYPEVSPLLRCHCVGFLPWGWPQADKKTRAF